MGWFGSLDLAYKYAIVFASLLIATLAAGGIKVFFDRRKLRKHVQEAEAAVEAAGKKGKNVEPNSRILDEGDLFGIRAIESGYFGGVAQSRPTSAAGTHSPSGSFSQTSMGGRPSPKIFSTSPSGSVVTIVMDSRRCSSPLARHEVSQVDEIELQSNSNRIQPGPIISRLRPSRAELDGMHKRDLPVNMSWNVPPSPTHDASPVFYSSSANNGVRTPSSSSQGLQTARHHHAASPQVALRKDINGPVQHSSTPKNLVHGIKSQSSPMMSPGIGNARVASGHRREPPPNIIITYPPKVPLRAAIAGKSIPTSKPVPFSTSGGPPSILHRAGNGSVQP